MKPGRLLVLSIVLAGLVLPASAQALTITGFTAQPADTQAGANSNFTIATTFGEATDQVQDVRIGLPPGLVADPTGPDQCTVVQLNANACPATSDVGDLTVNLNVLAIVPQTVTGNLYNLTPQPGEPARFGIVLVPPGGGVLLENIIIQSGAELRQSDFGLDSVILDTPNTANTTLGLGVPIDITGMTVALAGTVNGEPFARNPTSCSEKTTTITVNSWASEGTFVSDNDAFTPTNCGVLPFSPTFSAKITVPGNPEPDTKAVLETVIDQDNGEAGLRNALVQVPPALSADFNQLLPSEICSPSSFQASACPANTRIGSAIATSPLLTEPLTGPVVLVDNPGGVAKIGLDMKGPLNMQIQGQLGLDNSNAFVGLPDIPIAHFALTFNGGPDGLLFTGRDVCKGAPPVFNTVFEAHSGPTVTADTPAVVEGCGPPRSPRVQVKLKRPRSDRPKLVLKAEAASRFVPLTNLRLKLPKGLAFAKGDDFDEGLATRLPDSAVSNSRRKLRVNLGSGTNELRMKVGRGALLRVGRPSRKLSFPVRLLDLEGTSTSLRAKP